MMEEQDKLKTLYSTLKNDGYDDIGTEEQFRGAMKDKQKAGQLYSVLKNDGYDDIGQDEDAFYSALNPVREGEKAETAPKMMTQEAIPVKSEQVLEPEPMQVKPVEGFAEGFKQGWKGLKEGMKYFSGEVANLFTGSGEEEKRALKRLEELEANGSAGTLATWSGDGYKGADGNKVYVPEGAEREDLDLIAQTIKEAGGDIDKAKRMLAERAEKEHSWGDEMKASAAEGMKQMRPTKGFGAWVGNLVPQMIPSAAAIALSVVTKNPKYANMLGGVGIGGMTASTAGQSMMEAREAGASNAQTWAVGITDGVIELATEKIPFDNYTKRLFNGVKKDTGRKLAEAVTDSSSPVREEMERLLTKANKKLGGKLLSGKNAKDYITSIAAEGASEFTAEALQTITPMIYENPEDYPSISEILWNGWEGAKAGLFMGAALGGASKIAEHHEQRSRRKEQGYVDVAQVHLDDNDLDVVEIVGMDEDTGMMQVLHDGKLKEVHKLDVEESHRFSFEEFDKGALDAEVEESYNNGYSLHTAEEMNDAKNMYDYQRERMKTELGVNDEALADEAVDWIGEAQNAMDSGTEEGQKRADTILGYLNAKQVRDGMMQRVRDDIDARVEQSDAMVDDRTNRTTGMIQGATMKQDDRRVYVVAGRLVKYADGSSIDNKASDGSIIVRDAETGALEQVSPESVLSVDEPLNPIDEKYWAAEAIRQQYAQQEADKMDGKATFNQGDTYAVAGEDGKAVNVTVTANAQGIVDNGDGTVNVTDGTNVFAMPKETIQQAKDAEGMARVVQFEQQRQAEMSAGQASAVKPQPRLRYDDEVALMDDSGNVTRGSIQETNADGVLVDVEDSATGMWKPLFIKNDELEGRMLSVVRDGKPLWNRGEDGGSMSEAQLAEADVAANEAEASALERIPVNEKGEQDFESALSVDTAAALLELSDGVDDAKDTAMQMIGLYKQQLKKAEKAKTTGGSILEIVRLKQEKKAELERINGKMAYWSEVAEKIEEKRPGGIMVEAEAASEENQQRLAQMTAEEQKAAQEEVQRKIDAGAYGRVTARKRVRYVKEDMEMGTANTPLEHVLREIATGRITFRWSDEGATKGLGAHLGLSESNKERMKLIWALSGEGMLPEVAAEQIHADMPAGLQGMVSDQDIFNMILDAFMEYGSARKMWEAAKAMHGTDELESLPDYEADMERQAMEWEAEQNRMTVEEWAAYCDYIEEELEKMYAQATDEEINAIFEAFYNDITAKYGTGRNETEGAGGTEGQTDREQGDGVRLENGSDNAQGADGGAKRALRADEADGEGRGVVSEQGSEVTRKAEGAPTIGEQVQAAEAEVNTAPTDKQKEAGNYKKGHVQVGTFDITIEQPKGSVRSGVDANGKKWETKMQNTYGYIRGTEGVDGDHIDVFLSDDIDGWNGRRVFVVDQYNEDGTFDEHKVMLGFNEADDAEAAYFANYDKDWAKKHKVMMTAVTLEEFEKWIESSHRKTKAFAEYRGVKTSGSQLNGKEVSGIIPESRVHSSEKQGDVTKSSEAYSITPAQYTTKKGKVLDMQLVTPKVELSKDGFRSANALAKSLKGWFDAKQRGFLMRSEEDAKEVASFIEKMNAPEKAESVEAPENETYDESEDAEALEETKPEVEASQQSTWKANAVPINTDGSYDIILNGEQEHITITKDFGNGVYVADAVNSRGEKHQFIGITEEQIRKGIALMLDKTKEDAQPVVEKHDSSADDANEYRYRLTIRPFSIGTQPDGHLRHEDDGSPYGVVVYDHPLTRREAENFSLTPLTEAKGLEGKSFEVPFGKSTLKYKVDSVDENGRVKFHINGEHERSLPYYRFLDEIGDKAKEVAEGANRDAAEKQDAGEKSSAEIEAAWKKRIDGYIKEHYPAISERSENGIAQRSASRKDKVLTEMRDKAQREITAMKEKEGVFGERVAVVSGEFPKGLPDDKVITKKQKGGKRTVTENVSVAMVDGDLYLKRYVRGDDLRNVSLRIPGAKRYDINEIKYRLDLGIDTSTDAVRLMGDAIDELYKRGDFQESVFEKAERIAKEFEEKKRKQAESARETHHVAEEPVSLEKWKKMDGDERMQEAGKHPLLREEIENASSDDVLKANALDYLNGNRGMIQSVSYLKVYEDVRYTNRTAAADSGATDSAQLDTPATGNEQRVDVRDRGQGGNSNGRMDRGAGEDGVSAEGGPLHADPSDAGGITAGTGNASSEPLPVRGSVLQSGDSRSDEHSGSSVRSGEGRNVGGRTGRKSGTASRKNSKRGVQADTERNAKDDRGLDSNGSLDKELADAMKEFDGVLDEFKRAGKEELSMSLAGMSSRQMEVLPRLIAAGAKVGYTFLKKGVHSFAEWAKQMRKMLGGKLADAGLSDNEIDAFIAEMWKSKLPIDGQVHTLEEWASIIGKAELRKKVGESLEEKRKAQMDAEPIAVKVCDRENISETLPFLLPQQQDDVLKAETQFFDESHNDREHAYGKGYMFTNGTGTGKTYTGLGIVKRFIKQGKGRVLVLTPSQTKVKDWVKDAKNLGIELNDLDAAAKAKKDGTTATTEKGEGAVITTYANFRQNRALLEDLFDLIVYDESHRLLENKEGAGTAGALQHYKLSNRNKNYSFLRLQEINPVWNALKAKQEEFDAERGKLIGRLKKEYGIADELVLMKRGELPPALNGNWTGEMERKFPELAKVWNEVNALRAKYEKEIKPKLEEEAKANAKHTKVVFLSATPFNTRENLEYAEGYIFSYPENDRQVGHANQSPRSQFYLEHFGAGYRWRYNRLESSTTNAEAVSKQEVEFSDYLQHTLQTMSGRIIDSPYDYSRDFPTVTMEKADAFNAAMEKLSTSEATSGAYRGVMGDYTYTSALFESMKVAQIIPRLKEHLARGRKVVVFHRRVEMKKPLERPFETILNVSEAYWTDQYMQHNSDKEKAKSMLLTIKELRKRYADLLSWEQGLDLRMPREQLADAFGKDGVLFFSGKESKKAKDKAVADFNSDTSGKNIMVIQEDSGKEGISLHDTTGAHQRVLVTLALPQSPITALQIEGRIYRIGNKSNAIFEYPLLGLNAEMMLFGQKFNQQVSTTENLALGSQARNLRESFARGVEDHSGDVDIDGQGVGGKELDAPYVTETDGFDRAVLDYYTNQKLTGRRNSREGQDYYPTPEPLGYMMNQWGRIGEGESVLEPSAGHGAIARYVPRENPLTAVEPSHSLFSKLQIKAGGNGRKFENDFFENYNVVNKHDVVLMNPPFGVGGRMAVDHVAKAFQHLDEGGRVVAIIPRGSTDKKFDKWYEEQKDAVLTAEIGLPDITFERAGTSVNCRVVVIDKVTNKDLRGDAASRAVHVDLSGRRFDKIEDFFEEIRDIRVPERTIDHKARLKKKAASVARELRGMKGIKKVDLNENRIYVDGRGMWTSLQWGDWQGEALTRHLADEYARFRKAEEYAADRGEDVKAAVYGELKGLCCKLAGMTEDEMQRYILKKESGEDENLQRGGDGVYTDEELSYANDPLAKWMGESGRSEKQQRAHAARVRERMAERVRELAEQLHLDNVETVTDASTLEGKKRTAKGFYSKGTGKITIVVPNHSSVSDIEQTLLHEAVAHYGLRKLFGEHFDTFLDNVFNNADENIRKRIMGIRKNLYRQYVQNAIKGVESVFEQAEIIANLPKSESDFTHTATEEYLAGLAEGTEFEAAYRTGWWQRIKGLFLDMLHRIGFENFRGVTLTDNELRYILWRSYENLKEPGRYRSIWGEAADVAKQYELKVGNYANGSSGQQHVADSLLRENDELSSIIEKAKKDGSYMKAPNGKKSNLNERQWAQVRTRAFKEWFGDWENAPEHASQILDENGEPRVVYHGTDNEFSIFDRSFLGKNTDDNASDESFARTAHTGFWFSTEQIPYVDNHMPTYLNFKNPLRYDSLEDMAAELGNVDSVEEYLSQVENDGYDSIIVERDEEYGGTSYVALKSNQIKSATNNNGDFNPDDPDIYFRDGDPEIHERALARDRYEERVRSGMYQMREAMADSMLGLKEAMKAILGDNTDIADVEGFENAYLGENRLSSVNKAEADAFANLCFKPMLDEVARLARNETEREELTDYMMAKHGLERNEIMARRKAAKEARQEFAEELYKAQKAVDKDPLDTVASDKLDGIKQDIHDLEEELYLEYREKDFAGLTALTETDNVADAEAEANAMVSDYESRHDTSSLWEKTRDVSKSILQKSYECGLMSKAVYDDISGMYEHYIPLRGFDEKTSAEAYAYLTHEQSAFNAPMKKAKGRKSKADDPFANLQSMAESAIMQGNRNRLVKQRFLNFVLNHPSDLVSVSEIWLEHDDVTDEWKPVFPDNIDSTDTPEEVEQKMQHFEAKMKLLSEKNPDKYKHGKDAVDIPYRVVESRDLKEHQVIVKRNGHDYVLTINGNPRAAQALNGQTNPDNDTSGAIGAILRAGEKVNRHLSAFYTTRNPDFVVSNFVRDMLYTNSMAWIKESPNYALRFHRNFGKANIVRMKRLLAKHRKGTLDMNDKTEAMFHLFMMNGGETGYSNIRDIEQHKNDIRRELKKANGKIPVRKAFELLGERLDELNRAVENSARFAAFMTSREMGRSIDRAIYDAKEISVNFNKKGSGAKFLNTPGQTGQGNAAALVSGLGRSGFVFWNAAIQGATNFGRQVKRHPAKAFAGMAAMYLLGALTAFMGGDDDDDDDKNSYYNLPEYVRRSNILFRAGDSWVSIPLPVEYRAVYGMGELMVSVLNGKEHLTGEEIAHQMAGQVTQIMPIDFLEGGGGLNAFVPSAAKPLWEAYVAEKSWTGMPIYKDTPYNKSMPEWTKAYKSANKYIVGLANAMNEVSGGDPYTKGAVDFNPAKVEYLLNGYFGGVFGTIDKMVKTAETIAGAREYDPRNVLLLNRLSKSGDERTEYRAVNKEYFRLKEEHDNLKSRLKHYENDTDNGIFDYAEKIDFLYNSPEYLRYEIFEEYQGEIDALYDELKITVDGEERKAIEEELNSVKAEMIEKTNQSRKQ